MMPEWTEALYSAASVRASVRVLAAAAWESRPVIEAKRPAAVMRRPQVLPGAMAQSTPAAAALTWPASMAMPVAAAAAAVSIRAEMLLAG